MQSGRLYLDENLGNHESTHSSGGLKVAVPVIAARSRGASRHGNLGQSLPETGAALYTLTNPDQAVLLRTCCFNTTAEKGRVLTSNGMVK